MVKKSEKLAIKLRTRSRLTNGTVLLPSIDGRSIWSRRFRDLNGLFASDLGNEPESLSEGQKALVRRSSALCVELEAMEDRFARNKGATIQELEVFQRATSTLRRLIESLGINRGRVARDVTPTLSGYLEELGARKADAIDVEEEGLEPRRGRPPRNQDLDYEDVDQ